MWQQQLSGLISGDFRSLARCISLVENEAGDHDLLLQSLQQGNAPIIGITGPPGAGKSTLTDSLIEKIVEKSKKVAVVCVDPSSTFHSGALLGDRIRMNRWHNSASVFIRSVATRGTLGGLNAKIIEITDVLKAAPFDYIIIETAGVGQSEIEIASLADVTVVVLVPESGDEIQTMKSGLMEIANIFVVNKSDRPGSDIFIKNLRMMLSPDFHDHEKQVPVVETVATENKGISELLEIIIRQISSLNEEGKLRLLAQKAYQLIRERRMKDVQLSDLLKAIELEKHNFNLYAFIKRY